VSDLYCYLLLLTLLLWYYRFCPLALGYTWKIGVILALNYLLLVFSRYNFTNKMGF